MLKEEIEANIINGFETRITSTPGSEWTEKYYCAYILIPEDSFLYNGIKEYMGKNYDFYGWQVLNGFKILRDVHEEWTYCEKNTNSFLNDSFKGSGYVIGWDCAHGDDDLETCNVNYNLKKLHKVTLAIQKKQVKYEKTGKEVLENYLSSKTNNKT